MERKKLIILGNGFDLSFGLKTTYKDLARYCFDNYNCLFIKLTHLFLECSNSSYSLNEYETFDQIYRIEEVNESWNNLENSMSRIFIANDIENEQAECKALCDTVLAEEIAPGYCDISCLGRPRRDYLHSYEKTFDHFQCMLSLWCEDINNTVDFQIV